MPLNKINQPPNMKVHIHDINPYKTPHFFFKSNIIAQYNFNKITRLNTHHASRNYVYTNMRMYRNRVLYNMYSIVNAEYSFYYSKTPRKINLGIR